VESQKHHKLIMDFLKDISSQTAPKIIAEIGINHDGSLERAKYLASLAIDSGAHIVKTQFHIPSAEMSAVAKTIVPGHCDQSIYSIMDQCSLSLEDEIKLKNYIESRGGNYLSTPFSIEAASLLYKYLGVECFKIGSGECNNLPLLKKVASYKLPVILSTGLNSLASATRSYKYLLENGCPKVYLMHTTNLYPTPIHLVRLGGITELQSVASSELVGLSDHTTSNLACLGATALGAVILERHFIDTKDHPGPDVINSMTPQELKRLREDTAHMHAMRGGSKSNPLEEEEETRDFAFATVVVNQDLPSGTVIARNHLDVKRPRAGEFDAAELEDILGKELSQDICADTHLLKKHLK
tara:strand:- start:3955 stop:5019 length:1065 start_codon:yes stop_codon:yes gene_type:complete